MDTKIPKKYLFVLVGLLFISGFLFTKITIAPTEGWLTAKSGGDQKTLLDVCPDYSTNGETVKNGGFEDYVDLIGGFLSENIYFSMFDGEDIMQNEICDWKGIISPDNRDIFDGEQMFGRLYFVKHTSGYLQSAPIYQTLEDPLAEGDYTLSIKVRKSNGPLVYTPKPIGIVLALSDTVITVPIHYQNLEDLEDDMALFDKIIYASSSNEFTNDEWETFTYDFSVENEGLQHLYIGLLGFPPEFPFDSPGGKIRAYLAIDDVEIDAPSACNIASIAPTDSAIPPVYKNEAGNFVEVSMGEGIPLGITDNPVLENADIYSSEEFAGGGILVSRIAPGQLDIVSLYPAQEFSLAEIQEMFDFENINITAFGNDPEEVFGEIVFDATPKHNYLAYECTYGADGEYTGDPINEGEPWVDIQVQKEFEDSTLSWIDRMITYKVTVSNVSPNTATNIVVNETIPSGLLYMSHEIEGAGGTYMPNTGIFEIENLSPYESSTLLLTVKVPKKTCGDKINTASLIAVDQLDPYNNDTDTLTLDLPDCQQSAPTRK